MPLPVIADTFRVALVSTANVQPSPVVNVVHIRSASDVAAGDIADAVETEFNTGDYVNLLRPLSSAYALAEIHVTKLDGSSATVIRSRGANPWPEGSGSGDIVPASCAILKLQTAKRGRSYRGRVFLGPNGESDINTGNISVGVKTATDAAWVAWIDALVARDPSLTVAVASYLHRTSEPTTEVGLHSRVGTQRRRQHYL